MINITFNHKINNNFAIMQKVLSRRQGYCLGNSV